MIDFWISVFDPTKIIGAGNGTDILNAFSIVQNISKIGIIWKNG